jgi:hypothetical protein
MKYYIQYSTDYHLLIALSQALEKYSNVTIIGPKTPMSLIVSNWSGITHLLAAPEGCYSYHLIAKLIYCKGRKNKNIAIYSPYLIPFYTLNYLIGHNDLCSINIYRTDEGVGSNANLMHYYKGIRYSGKSQIYSILHAIYKTFFRFFVNFFGISVDSLLIDSSGCVDQIICQQVKGFLDNIGRKEDFNSKLVVCTQPGIEDEYGGGEGYARFLSYISKSINNKKMVIKKHPKDNFDYKLFGFDECLGEALELYELTNSVLIGWSSTSLLTASIFSNCESIYYIDSKLFRVLSPVNKHLFKTQLQEFDIKPYTMELRDLC